MQNTAQDTAAKDAADLIAKLELPYLIALRRELDKHIEARRGDAIADAREKIRKLAADAGLRLEDLVAAKPIKAKLPLPVKYRHPQAPELQWSGRGRQPQWIKEWLDTGKRLTEIEV